MQLRNNRPGDDTRGFTLLEIMIVVSIIGLLAAIAIPNFIKSTTVAKKNNCINNQRKIDDAVAQWAIENKKGSADPVGGSDISAYLKNSVACPAGGTSFDDSYQLSDVQSRVTCLKNPAAHIPE